ncbi:putative pilus assembly protein FilE [Acinetobacter sp. TSRC1-2]|uniref:putative pilus assembly protein FilE n=1 Tax=unclassified Acinetobacter TaxID=196816 RepID=UPI003CECE4DF
MKSILMLCVAQVSFSYAGEFYTIIGPDGRPMIVQQQIQPKPKVVEVLKLQQPVTTIQNNVQEAQSQKTVAEIKLSKPAQLQVENGSISAVTKKNNSALVNEEHSHPLVQIESKNVEQIKDVSNSQSTLKNEEMKVHLPDTLVKQKESENTDTFMMIAGEKYIKNEYLENKEFNLEGKKRFYAMPEGVIDIKHGATRLQMVEREKGVSKSLLQSIFKKNQKQDTGPITLSSTYYRVSQADAIESLGQQCIKDKKIKNAKTVSLDKEVNVWPRAPLKEQFDFEIVKVSNAIQNIQINSYASRQQNPTFYWPFVVFLDSSGCVLEGTGGFKNHEAVQSFTTYQKIEGIVHIPPQSQYILLTPLASAIDLENKALTNQGQLKLIAIR